MWQLANLGNTLDAVRSASALTEATFLHLGQTLEASTAILSGLISSFETAMTQLEGEDLGRSLKALGEAGTRVAQLGHGHSEVSATFDHLQRAAEAIARRISKLNGSIKALDSLVTNSKIAATAIRGSEIDFTTFTSEIGNTMSLAQTTLDSFGSELQALRERIRSAYAGQLAIEKRQIEAIRSIPDRLKATVTAIPAQHKRAARAISAVRQRSQRVQEQVNSAVMALQSGDITRQRLEHAEHALGFLTKTGRSAVPRSSEERSSYAALPEDQQRALAATTCLLQAAQLSDAAAEFERNVGQLAAALNNLAAEARALRSLASSAYRSAGHDQGTFIVELEAQVGEALELFADFGASQADAARVMAAVSDAAKALCDELATVQSLEADIRILGLNTTLRCARVGPEGRVLGLIAQELRAYGNEFAKEAGGLMGEVENLGQITRSIGSKQADAAPLMAAAMQAMKDALSTLRQVGLTLDDTLSGLDRDSDRVAILLQQSAANLEGHDEIDKAIRSGASSLQDMSRPGALPLADLTPDARHVLDLMARGYTMAIERTIHLRIVGESSEVGAAKVAATTCELDDMLF
jgi:hypothetical protein